MKEKIYEEIQNSMNGDLNSMYKMALTTLEKYEGTLKDCLNKYDDMQLEIIDNTYEETNKKFKNMSKSEKVGYLEKHIKSKLEKGLTHLTTKGVLELSELLKNPKHKITTSALQSSGIVFRSFKNEKETYYIPEDIKKIVQKQLKQGALIETETADTSLFMLACHFVYGLIPKDIFQDILLKEITQIDKMDIIFEKLSDKFEYIKIDNKEYIWPNQYPVVEEAKQYLNKQEVISYSTIMFYFIIAMQLISDIMDATKGKETDIIIIFKELFMSPKSINEIVDNLKKKLNLTEKQTKKLRKVLNDKPELRYWSLGGKTIAESQLKDFILNKKPEDETLEGCLNSLNQKALELLYEKYQVDNIEDLGIEIFNSIILEDYDKVETATILNYQKEEYEESNISANEIIHGYFYLYKENNKIKILIPTEIETMLSDSEEDILDAHNLVGLYMITNGIIKKEKLQELLKENHNINYSIKELDREILSYQYNIIDDYYSLLPDISDEERLIIISQKQNREYKIVGEETAFQISCLTDMIEEIGEILDNTSYDYELIETLKHFILITTEINSFSPEIITEIMEEDNIKLDKNTFRKIINTVNKYKNDIPLWTFNGFTKKEINSRPKRAKVGRNDPCPCGSGKKYKKCCGK